MTGKTERVANAFGQTMYRVGDLVTRDGTDIQRVIDVIDDSQCITVKCIKEPLGFLEDDGITRSEPWCRIGDVEVNMAHRYEYAHDAIEVHWEKKKRSDA